jgi:hypothetical protein
MSPRTKITGHRAMRPLPIFAERRIVQTRYRSAAGEAAEATSSLVALTSKHPTENLQRCLERGRRPGNMYLTTIARNLTWLFVAVALQLASVACGPSAIATPGAGRTPPTTPGANSQSRSPLAGLPSPPPPDWVSYSDSQLNFSLRLPPNFTVQVEGGAPDFVRSYRAYDPQQAVNGYPRGQIEFAIYTKDANSVRDWVARHTRNALRSRSHAGQVLGNNLKFPADDRRWPRGPLF